MKSKQKTIVLLIASLLIFSTTTLFAEAKSNEKIKVLIGFNGIMQPDLIRYYGGKIDHEIGISNAIATSLSEIAIKALQNNPNIAYIELDQKVYILEDSLEWGVDRIDAEIVWGGSEDASSVTGNAGVGVNVWILDTGVDYTHVELDDNYVNDGYDFVNDDSDPMDDHWHGTHCAGIVAAEDNGIGIIGVAPEVNLHAVKVLDAGGSGYLSDVAAGIDWAVSHGADVISMSLGGVASHSTLENACNNAYNQGVVLVAAAGNSGNPSGRGDTVEYPARYDSVIAVASIDSVDKRAKSSSTGPDVEISAPGVYITSTYPGNRLATASGTSMACPHVAGVAALIISSELNVNVRDQLAATAEDLGDPGRDNFYGYGLVDAEAAAGAPPLDNHDVAITSINAPSSVIVGGIVSIDLTVTNEGTFAETTTVTITDTYDGGVIGSQEVTLNAGASIPLTFTWNTAGEALTDHTLDAYANPVDGETETADNTKTTTVNIYEQTTPPQGDMWVKDISWNKKVAGPNRFLYFTVIVTSSEGLVSDATVNCELTLPTGSTQTFTGTTDGNGEVRFTLKTVNTGEYEATITDITHSTYTYNSGLNQNVPYEYTLI